MSESPTAHSSISSPSLIDELRAIRRTVTDPFGDDVGQLCDHLREVERQYAAHSGMFAGLPTKTADQVVAAWGDQVNDLSDPLIDEVRALRSKSPIPRSEG